MRLNICLHVQIDSIEEGERITDTIKCALADHPEMAMSSTGNIRFEPQETKPNETHNNPGKGGIRPFGG